MNDKPSMSPLPPEVDRLLEVERSRPGPPATVVDRMYGRLALVVGLPTGPGGPDGTGGAAAPTTPPTATGIGSGGAAAAAAAQAGVGASSGVAITVAFIAGAIGGSVATHLLHQRGDGTAAIASQAAAAAAAAAVAQQKKTVGYEAEQGKQVTQIVPPRAAATIAAPVSSAEASPKPNTSKAEQTIDREPAGNATGDKQLAAERGLVERARSALIRSRPDDALAAIERHREGFPNGKLAEEREALRVLALVAAGEGEEARQIARRFRRRYPQSFLLPTIDAALATRPQQRADREKPANLE